MKENVYLIPWKGKNYIPCISDEKPLDEAVLLTPVGSFPTLYASATLDAYGIWDVKSDIIYNRTELLRMLYLDAMCCSSILKLWKHDLFNEIEDELSQLFDDACIARESEARGSGDLPF